MAGTITIPGMFLTGTHAARPAASAVGKGSLYACSDHKLIYQSDGSSWTTWLDATGTGSASVATDAIWDTKGDLAVGTGANTAAKLVVGANGTRLVADSSQSTGQKWQGIVGVRCRMVADQALTSGSIVYIPWDTEDYDTDAFHSTVSNQTRLVVPSGLAGKYHIDFQGFMTSSPGAGNWCQIRKNGTTTLFSGPVINDASTAQSFLSGTVELAAADYVELGVRVGAASKNLTDAGVSDPFINMELIGQ